MGGRNERASHRLVAGEDTTRENCGGVNAMATKHCTA